MKWPNLIAPLPPGSAALSLVAAMTLEADAANVAQRTLPRLYTPNVPITVTISVPMDGTSCGFFRYVIDRPPTNWIITGHSTNASYSTNFTSTNGASVFWILVEPCGEAVTNVLTYTIVPRANESGIKYLWGQTFLASSVEPVSGDREIGFDANGDGIADAPPLNIRVSPLDSTVTLCWLSVTNRTYQSQYTTSLQPILWNDLGTSMPGTGGTNCVSEAVLPGERQRFYRLIEMP